MFSQTTLESAPFLLAFVASFVDTFALSGLFVWGYGVVVAVGLMIQQNVHWAAIFLFCWASTLVGEGANFALAKWLRQKPFIQKHIASVQHKRWLKFCVPHRHDPLWRLTLKFVALRFIFFARPLATLLGTAFGVRFWPWAFAQSVSSAVWVAVWYGVMMGGLEIFQTFFRS